MPIKLNGATSGSVELDVPAAVGSDLQLTLPATAGDVVVKAADGSVDLGNVDIDSSGRLLVGTSTALTNVYQNAIAITPQNQFASQQSGYNGGLSLINYSSQGYSSTLSFGQSMTDTLGANALTTNGEPLGKINFTGNDGTNFRTAAQIMCNVDGVTGSGDMPGRLTFHTTADGAASPTERVRITNLGSIQAVANTNVDVIYSYAAATGTTATCFRGGHSATAGSPGTGTDAIYIFANGNVQNTNNSYGAISDVKLKENIVDAGSQWDDLKAVRFRKYNFKAETKQETHTQLGVIAQELELTSPGLVSESPDKETIEVPVLDADGNPVLDFEGNPKVDFKEQDAGTVTKSVNYSVLYMKAVKALQEAMTRIETLETKVAALEATP